jgi:hypothetical protein
MASIVILVICLALVVILLLALGVLLIIGIFSPRVKVKGIQQLRRSFTIRGGRKSESALMVSVAYATPQ